VLEPSGLLSRKKKKFNASPYVPRKWSGVEKNRGVSAPDRRGQRTLCGRSTSGDKSTSLAQKVHKCFSTDKIIRKSKNC